MDAFHECATPVVGAAYPSHPVAPSAAAEVVGVASATLRDRPGHSTRNSFGNCHNVMVENRWAAETELGAVFGWADALILPYHEASQSGVAAAAIAAGRPVIATRVGGLSEQLSGIPHTMLCEPDPASL
jgi:glycosyltransferase involved in cell wall biosynthesis